MSWYDTTMKIYFAGSIRGGRSDVETYAKMIAMLEKHGQVLDKHIGDPALHEFGERDISDAEIKQRDQAWINEADCVVAELSHPSHGVGYEVGLAMHLGKPILGLFRRQTGRRVSPMIAGAGQIEIKHYNTLDEVHQIIQAFFCARPLR